MFGKAKSAIKSLVRKTNMNGRHSPIWHCLPLDVYQSMKLRALSRQDVWGDSCYCPICGTFTSEWKTYGRGHKTQCHVCFSLGRHRHIWWRLVTQNCLMMQGSVLHFAPEPWLKKILMQVPGLEYIDADIEPGKTRYCMDIANVRRPNNSIDVVLCNHVLEHVVDDHKAVSELARVLKPDGMAFLTVPILSLGKTKEDRSADTAEKRLKAHKHPEHFRAYGLAGFRSLLAEQFVFTEFEPGEFSSDPLLSKSGFEDIIFKCVKKR